MPLVGEDSDHHRGRRWSSREQGSRRVAAFHPHDCVIKVDRSAGCAFFPAFSDLAITVPDADTESTTVDDSGVAVAGASRPQRCNAPRCAPRLREGPAPLWRPGPRLAAWAWTRGPVTVRRAFGARGSAGARSQSGGKPRRRPPAPRSDASRACLAPL